MLSHARMALATLIVLSTSSAYALADNDLNYIKYRSDKFHALRSDSFQASFNPYDYDVSHMTPEEQFAYDQQRRQAQQRAMERLTATNLSGSSY